MITFADKPVHPWPDPISDDLYELVQDYSYVWENKGYFYRLNVKKGFKYDLASVPNCLGWLIDMHPDGLHRTAATVHDLLYERKGVLLPGEFQILAGKDWINFDIPWTRQDADKLFARILRESGVSKFKRRMAYRAVRLGGWTAWHT